MRILVFCIAITSALCFIDASQAQEQLDSHQSQIDSIVSEHLAMRGTTLSQPADKNTLVRRISVNLMGRLPSFDQVQRFVQKPNPESYLLFVDECLASPEFAERTAMEWLLAAQYSDQTLGLPSNANHLQSFRDWVVSSIDQNQPVDQFLLWQLAGDMLPNASDQQRLATAFLRLGDQVAYARENEELHGRENAISSRLELVARTILDSNVQCARCHDSPTSLISHTEHLQFGAFFGNVTDGSRETGSPPSRGESLLLLAAPFQKQQIKSLETAIKSVRQAYDDEIAKIGSTSSVEKWHTDLLEWPQPKDAWLAAEFDLNPSAMRVMEINGEITSKALIANQVAHDKPASLDGMVQWDSRGGSSGLRLDGINPIIFPRIGAFAQANEFSICMEVHLPAETTKASVLHRSNAEIRSESTQGYALTIENGHLVFSLAHHRIHSAITIRTKSTVPTDQWTHIGIVYAGSSRADETWIFLDGKRCEVEVVQDNLRKEFAVDPSIPMYFGARKGEPGLVGAVVSQLQIFDVALTEIEMDGLVNDIPIRTWEELSLPEQAMWLNHYAKRVDAQCRYHLESYQHYLQTRAAELREVPAVFVMNEHAAPSMPSSKKDIPKAWWAGEKEKPTNRLELAKWLIGSDQTRVARSIANHAWKQMFGTSLHSADADELLDYLAKELMDSGWDRKHLYRTIARSKTFQQSSLFDTIDQGTTRAKTPLHFYPTHRMNDMVYRDVALQYAELMSEQRTDTLARATTGQNLPRLFPRSLVASWDQSDNVLPTPRIDTQAGESCPREPKDSATSLRTIGVEEGPTWRMIAFAITLKELRKAEPLDDDFDGVIDSVYHQLLGRECTNSERSEHRNFLDNVRDRYQNSLEDCDEILREGERLGLDWPFGLHEEKATVASLCVLIESILLSEFPRLVR